MTLSLNWTQHLSSSTRVPFPYCVNTFLFGDFASCFAFNSSKFSSIERSRRKKNLHNLSIENVNFQWELLLLTLIFWNVQQFSTAKKNCKSSVIFAFEKKKDLKMSFLNFWVLQFSSQKSLLVAEQFSNTNTTSHYLLNITKNHPNMFKNAKI